MEQYDLFGGVSEPIEPEPPRRKTMQEVFGTISGKTCKDCKHLIIRQYANKYYKCDLWFMSSGPASDIRIKHACGKWEGLK